MLMMGLLEASSTQDPWNGRDPLQDVARCAAASHDFHFSISILVALYPHIPSLCCSPYLSVLCISHFRLVQVKVPTLSEMCSDLHFPLQPIHLIHLILGILRFSVMLPWRQVALAVPGPGCWN